MARVGRGDDIIGQFSTLLSGGKKGLLQWKEYVKYDDKTTKQQTDANNTSILQS